MAGLEDAITSELGVPVIDGVAAAVSSPRPRWFRAEDQQGLHLCGPGTKEDHPAGPCRSPWPAPTGGADANRSPRGRACDDHCLEIRSRDCRHLMRSPEANQETSHSEVDLASRWLGGSRACGKRRILRREGKFADTDTVGFRARPLRPPRRDRRWLGDEAASRTRPRLGANTARRGRSSHRGRRRHKLLYG